MRRLFLIDDTLANKVSFYHVMLLMASLPFDRFYSHLMLISFGIHTLIHLDVKRLRSLFTWQILAMQAVFYITVLSSMYTKNTGAALTEWGKQVTIFVLPLLLCLNPLDLKKYRPQLLLSFSLVCTATVIYLYADAMITIRHYGLPYKYLFTGAFTNHNFSEPIDMHATFFSMQVALSLIYLIIILLKPIPIYIKVFCAACCAVLLVGLVQLSSKSVMITLFLVINMALPIFLLKQKARWRYLGVSVSLSVLIAIVILRSAAFKERFVSELRDDLSGRVTSQILDSRRERWKVAVAVIEKAPVAGHGAGTEEGLLADGFFKNKLYNSYLNRLNAHDQYLSFLLTAGVIGLLIYLAVLAFGFTIAIRQKDLLFFGFMALTTIVSLSEDLLAVDKGIFFYAFFFSFFSFSMVAARSIAPGQRPEQIIYDKATKRQIVPSSL